VAPPFPHAHPAARNTISSPAAGATERGCSTADPKGSQAVDHRTINPFPLRHNLALNTLLRILQHEVRMSARENQFSFTRATLSTCGRANKANPYQ